MALPEPPPLGTAMLPAGTFAGMVVVVTGGGTGLGKAIGVEFARLGAAVAVVSRDAAHGAAGVSAMEAVGGRAVAVGADVRDPESVANAFDDGRAGARARRRPGEQRSRKLHGARGGHERERMAVGDRDRARRDVLLLDRVRSSPYRARVRAGWC